MNNVYKYIFKSERVPNELTLHSFNSHLVERENLENYRTDIYGLELHLSTDKELKDETLEFLNSIKFFDKKRRVDFYIKFIKHEKIELEEIYKDDIYDLSGIMSYGINVNSLDGKRGRKVCPLNSMGKFRTLNTLDESNKGKRSLKSIFIETLENYFGIEINKSYLARSENFFSRREDLILKTEEEVNKISKISNLIEINLQSVIIKEPEKFKSIIYKQFGQRKSYGFGKFIFEKVNNN